MRDEIEKMFGEKLRKRIKLFRSNMVSFSDSEFILRDENSKSEVTVKLSRPSILISGLEKNKPMWFDFGEESKDKLPKSDYNCADFVLFQLVNDTRFIIHIFELKSKLSDKEWLKTQLQFRGAYVNAKAISGYFEIEISDIVLHTAFSIDDVIRRPIENTQPITARLGRGRSTSENNIFNWLSFEVSIKSFENVMCLHTKIPLDEYKKGSCEI